MTEQQLQKQPLIIQHLEKHKAQIEAALPKHMTADRMARICTTEIRKNPYLLKCDPKSLFGAIIQAAQLGLEPGSALGHCYLVPYKRDLTLIIGYRGMIDLARRSGQIVSINARPVFEGDQFTYSFGLEDNLHHVPCEVDQRGEITHFYAVAKLAGGGVQWEVMHRSEIESIRDHSEGYRAFKAGKIRTNPWDSHFEEMGKKTVIRRLFKYLPVSIEMQTAVGLDEQADAGVPQQNDAVITGEWEVVEDEDADDESESEPAPSTGARSMKEKLREQEEA